MTWVGTWKLTCLCPAQVGTCGPREVTALVALLVQRYQKLDGFMPPSSHCNQIETGGSERRCAHGHRLLTREPPEPGDSEAASAARAHAARAGICGCRGVGQGDQQALVCPLSIFLLPGRCRFPHPSHCSPVSVGLNLSSFEVLMPTPQEFTILRPQGASSLLPHRLSCGVCLLGRSKGALLILLFALPHPVWCPGLQIGGRAGGRGSPGGVSRAQVGAGTLEPGY